ncbi:unnamed protein product, partial [Vitis vinifera]
MAYLLGVLLALLVVAPSCVKSLNPSLNDDVLGLIVFKADIQDPNSKLASWNEDDDSPCNWVGVKCNPRSNRVTDLVLDGFSLSGKIGRGLLQLHVGSCSTLAAIDFSSNQFSGPLPSGIWSLNGLRSLDLSDNLLEGDIPKGIDSLYNLRAINLSKNRFSGPLPDGIGGCLLLRLIDFSENSLSGSLPGTMQKLTLCNYMNLHGNSFEGEVPEWIGEMKSLETLDLSANKFSGRVPTSIGNLKSLKLLFLNISRNSLVGAIPASIGDLKALDVLDLSENQLNGSIPLEIGGAFSLKDLRLKNNFLAGKIPVSLENCSSLTTLILSHNNLSGPIPMGISKLSNLENVDLSLNKLTGSLPKQLANLPHLISFNISHNQLQGELPAGGFFNTISPSSVSGNPSLCGSAANKSCPAVLPKPIVLNPNSSSDTTAGAFPRSLAHKKIILSISALIAIGAAAVIVIGVIAITVLNLRVRSSASRSAAALALSGGDDYSHSPTTDANSGKLVMFSGDPDFSMGAHALLNKDCELGRGGFGAVYRTVLRDGHPVAIKKLTVSSLVKSQEDFEREVKKLGKIRHQNLVALEGYYWTPSLQLLIYEFISGGSFLAHLHQMSIIHYNLKSSNVLIDPSGEPKVADFGLARLLPMLDRYVLSSKIQSALGYMAPEFACRTVKITEKCDVYGFGVLVLEVVTGKRPVEYMEDDVVVLCDMVRGALEEGKVEECVDGRLQGKFPAEEAIPVMKLGLICTSQVPSNRPDMAEVVNILELIRCPSEGQEDLSAPIGVESICSLTLYIFFQQKRQCNPRIKIPVLLVFFPSDGRAELGSTLLIKNGCPIYQKQLSLMIQKLKAC